MFTFSRKTNVLHIVLVLISNSYIPVTQYPLLQCQVCSVFHTKLIQLNLHNVSKCPGEINSYSNLEEYKLNDLDYEQADKNPVLISASFPNSSVHPSLGFPYSLCLVDHQETPLLLR